MADKSPTPAALPTAPAPREVRSEPLQACPRWDTVFNGTVAEPGVALSGQTFTTNLSVPHEVVVLDADGNEVAGVVIDPANPITPGGGMLSATVSVTLPEDLDAGTYYLQVRPAGGTGGYSHTVELFVEAAPDPGDLAVEIVPAPGSEPGTYLEGTWITLDTDVTGGAPEYAYNWHLNGAPDMGTKPDFQFQIPTGGGFISVSVEVTDTAGGRVMSGALDFLGVLAGTFRIAGFRRDPDTSPVTAGTTVKFFAQFADGTPPYAYALVVDGESFNGTAPDGSEVEIGTHTFGSTGSFLVTLTANDSATGLTSATMTVDVDM